MSSETPWRRLWTEIDAALFAHGERLAKGEGQFLKEVRLAVTKYGRAVAPEAFDEYGYPREGEAAAPSTTSSGAPTMGSIVSQVRDVLPGDLLEKITVTNQGDGYVAITAEWLGKPDWSRVDGKVRQMGGKWISDGKRSRWEVFVP